jgi:hypothetical protein
VISGDYLLVTRRAVFRRDELPERAVVVAKILVVKDSMSKFIGAHLVPVKGLGSDRYAAAKMRRDIVWLGYRRVILKTDNEPAIFALLEGVLKGAQGGCGRSGHA